MPIITREKMKPVLSKTFRLIFMIMVGLLLLFSRTTAIAGTEGGKNSDMTDLNIEELLNVEIQTVYGASKFEQKVTEAPSAVSIVTAGEIKKYGYRTLADILRSLRSFYITYDRNYSFAGVRGFGRPSDYNDRILLLIDGHRTNDNITNGALIGAEFPVDVDLIDRIEVIRGPGSSLYGSNAFFAVINVITKRGRDLKGTEVSADAGSYDTFKERLSYGNRFQNGVEAVASVSGFDSRGQSLYFSEFDNPSNNNGVTNDTDYDRFKSAFLKLSYQEFTLESAYNSRTRGIPTGSFGADFNNPDNKTVDGLFFTDLKYQRSLGLGTDVAARLFYDHFQYEGDYIYSGVDNKDLERGEWWGGELKFSMKLFNSHRVVLGGEYQDNFKQQQENYDVAPYTLYTDDNRRSRIIAVYLQDEVILSKDLILNAGVRVDHYDTFGETTNPRFALIYNPFEKSFFKLLYGSAFRAPNNYELFYYSPGVPGQEANPGLTPETINTYELVIDQYFLETFHATAAVFYYRIKDLITETTDPLNGALVFNNIDEAAAGGAELELARKGTSGAEGRISYSFQDVKDLQADHVLTNSPRHLARVNLILPISEKKLFAGIEEQYTSERLTVAGNYAAGFFLTNLTLFSHNLFLKGLEVSASVYNLFNENYGDPGSVEHLQDVIRQNGRNYNLKLKAAF
jgi:iron complex outermembrane receptor protein